VKPATSLKPVRIGILLAAAYAAILVVTGARHPVRPLYDGAGFSVPYRWVNAPWYVGSFNVKPKAVITAIPFENGVSALTGVSSEDAQLVLNLPKGAIPARAGDTSVAASITPIDPTKMAAQPPEGLRPNGNAYDVALTYQPSKEAVPTLAVPGNVIMVVPDDADTILYSASGKGWQKLDSHLLGDPTSVGATFEKTGYYLGTTTLPEYKNPNKKNPQTLGAISVTVVLALTVGFFALAGRRRRSAAPPTGGRPGVKDGVRPSRTVRKKKKR
jgi:hypothetical protein